MKDINQEFSEGYSFNDLPESVKEIAINEYIENFAPYDEDNLSQVNKQDIILAINENQCHFTYLGKLISV